MEQGDLVGLYEIAELAGVSRQAVANWRSRFPEFPSPVAELKSGPVFHREQVRKWLHKRRGKMATVISMINLKGGVGKTTTSVAIAEVIAGTFRKNVLLIDLDPQTNATAMLIGDEKWRELNDQGHTLAQLFGDALDNSSGRQFDLEKTLQVDASPVVEVRRLDLLPSSLDFIDLQDRLGSMGSGRFFTKNPTDILRQGIKNILDNYEFVLIDCPPNMGIITLNGLRISNGFVIPVIPDRLSTYGVPQIVSRVAAFSEDISEDITPFGIVISKYRAQSTVHANVLRELRAERDAPLFETIIPEANKIAEAAEEGWRDTLRQRWGYGGLYDAYEALAEEIMEAAAA